MVVKKHSRQAKAAHKHVKLKAHHAKPYRKRHVGLLVISLASLVLMAIVLVSYRDQIISGLSSSRSFVGDLFTENKSYNVDISSTYGFNVSYDQRNFYASGIDNRTGDLRIGSELSQKRAYGIIRIAPYFMSSETDLGAASAFTMTLHPGQLGDNDTLEAIALQDGGLEQVNLDRQATATATLGGETFQKTTWQSKSSNVLTPSLNAKFVTYAGIVHGDVVTVVISLGVGSSSEMPYQSVLQSISFGVTIGAVAAPSAETIAKVQQSRSVLDTITNTSIAAAATGSADADLTGSVKVAALYSPAVVKIYNVYCMDVNIDGKAYLKNACSASSGSGFFVSQDGYLGTNGHVATANPVDAVISHAISAYVTKGDPRYLNFLSDLTTLKQSDIPANATSAEAAAIIVDAIYKLDPSRIVATNDVQNLLVQVTAKNPDVSALIEDTKNRKEYTDTSVLKATVEAADYRANDGYDGFKSSDVAIIKVSGKDFPIVKLGELDSVIQGADLSILGYPGNASSNGIVDSSSSQATLTTGKVSSKKNASKSDKMLIETDTTIGHGNSGGPALDDRGSVVGIATYTADGSGDGNGVFNYIRDIKDLVDLAGDSSITFDTNSATQTAWEEGITDFYTAHYTRALKSFKAVQELYPNNSRVAEFIAAAEKRIANGEDVVDFPLVPVIVASVVILLGIGVAIILIVRHGKKHTIYNAGVAQGTVQPVGPGVPTQKVFVSPNAPTINSPVLEPAAPTHFAPDPVVTVTPVAAPTVEVKSEAPTEAPTPTEPVIGQPPSTPNPFADTNEPPKQ